MDNNKEDDVNNVDDVNTVDNQKQNTITNVNQKSISFFVSNIKRIPRLEKLRRDSVPILSGQLAFPTPNSDGNRNRKRGRSKPDADQISYGFVPRVFPKGKKVGAKTVQGEKIDKRTSDEENTEEPSRSPKAKKQRGRDIKETKESIVDANKEKVSQKNGKDNEENEDDYSWHEEDVNTFDKYLMAAKKNGKIKKCIDCKKNYCAEYNNKAKIRCLTCNSNHHGCIREESCKTEKLCKTSKGYVWLCTDCREIIDSKDTDFIKKIREEIMKNNNEGKHMEDENYEHSEDGKNTGKNKNSNTKDSQNEERESNVPKTITEKFTHDDIILNYHGSNIREVDLRTLEEKNWINDTIISFFFEHLQRVTFRKNKQILFVSPEATQILKSGEEIDLPVILNQLGALHMEYIFFPVNNNETFDREGGTHWSLLVYNKNIKTWFHLDSMHDLNNVHARQLMNRVNTYMDNETPPKFVETNCTQQNNGYDCGTFTMMHAQETAKRAIEKLPLANCVVNRIATNKMRSVIKDLISIEIHMSKKKRNIDLESKQTESNVHISKEKGNKYIETKLAESERICHYWRKNICKKGSKCLFKHPELCETQIKTGKYQDYFTNICNKYHPMICLNNMRKEPCKYGERCKFRHINKENREYIQEQNQKINEFKENNTRTFHSSRDRNWQNTNIFEERSNQEYHHNDKYHHASQHYNGKWNQYDYNHSDKRYKK